MDGDEPCRSRSQARRIRRGLELAASAHARFDALGDRVGLGRVLQIEGTVAATRGDFAAAGELLEASLEIRRELDDKAAMGALLSNLGIMAEYDGDYDARGPCTRRVSPTASRRATRAPSPSPS